MLNKTIWVTSQFVGFHCWPSAPESVKFLRDLHRHVFQVKASVLVTHADRQVEFFILKSDLNKGIQSLEKYLKKSPHLSCEAMAIYLLGYLQAKKYRVVGTQVSEDGENGALVTNSSP